MIDIESDSSDEQDPKSAPPPNPPAPQALIFTVRDPNTGKLCSNETEFQKEETKPL